MDILNSYQFGDLALLALRLVIGSIFIVHGLNKLGTWKGPKDPMTNLMKLLSIAEPLGGLAIVLGLFTELAAVGLGLIMLGAIYLKISKWKTPFTTLSSTGWEFDLLILASCTLLMAFGPGGMTLQTLM